MYAVPGHDHGHDHGHWRHATDRGTGTEHAAAAQPTGRHATDRDTGATEHGAAVHRRGAFAVTDTDADTTATTAARHTSGCAAIDTDTGAFSRTRAVTAMKTRVHCASFAASHRYPTTMRFSPDPPSVPVNGTLVAAFAKAPFTPADAEAVRAQMAVVLTQPLTGFAVPPSDEVDGAIATDERVELAKTHTDAPGILRALADGRVRAAHLCKLPGVPPRLCMSMAVGDGAIPDLSRTQRQRLAELCARDEFLEARLRSLVHTDAQAEYARAYVMERQLRDAYPQYASLTHAEAVARFATERSSALQQYVFARKAYEQQNAHARLAAQRATADVVTFDAPSPVHPSLVGPANGTHGAPVAEGGNDDDTDDDAQQKRQISAQQKKRRAPAPPAPPPITTGADVHAVGARASLTFQALQLSDGGRNFAPIQVATGECITLDMLRWRALVVPDAAKPPAAPRMYFCVQAPSGATHYVYVMASMLQRLIDIDDAGWIALRNAILLPDADGTPTRQLAGIPQYMMLPAATRPARATGGTRRPPDHRAQGCGHRAAEQAARGSSRGRACCARGNDCRRGGRV